MAQHPSEAQQEDSVEEQPPPPLWTSTRIRHKSKFGPTHSEIERGGCLSLRVHVFLLFLLERGADGRSLGSYLHTLRYIYPGTYMQLDDTCPFRAYTH